MVGEPDPSVQVSDTSAPKDGADVSEGRKCPFAGKATSALAGFDNEREWCRAVLEGISTPKRDVASFELHAPLELMARAYLLPFVRKEAREQARAQMASVVERYQLAGEDVLPPPARSFSDIDDAASTLAECIDRGDVDEADAVAVWLESHASPAQLQRALGDVFLDHLGAAGDANAYLSLLGRTSAGYALTSSPGLRGFARELARQPGTRAGSGSVGVESAPWRRPSASIDAAELSRALRQVQPAGRVDGAADGSGSGGTDQSTAGAGEWPLLVLRSDEASDFTSLQPAFNEVLRVAAMAMLVESSGDARYGWSHCMTLPQAVSRLAVVSDRPLTALRVAADYVGGFRATLGTGPLPDAYSPEPVELAFMEAVRTSPAAAASAAWHTDPAARNELVTDLVTQACIRDDAHLVMYTLACLDAAQADRAAGSLYFAAAAHLLSVWVCDGPGLVGAPAGSGERSRH